MFFHVVISCSIFFVQSIIFKRTPKKPVRASLRAFEVVFRFLCGNKRYFCILHAENLVAKGKYARAVSCNNAGLFCSAAAVEAASFCYYIADYQLLRLNIQSAGCLIKQQYRCIAQNCSCNGKPLRLSLAYAVSLFPDAGIYAPHSCYKAERTCGIQCSRQFLVGCFRADNAKIFRNRSRKNRVALRNIGKQPAMFGLNGVSPAAVIHKLRKPAFRSNKPENQPKQRCFSCPLAPITAIISPGSAEKELRVSTGLTAASSE